MQKAMEHEALLHFMSCIHHSAWAKCLHWQAVPKLYSVDDVENDKDSYVSSLLRGGAFGSRLPNLPLVACGSGLDWGTVLPDASLLLLSDVAGCANPPLPLHTYQAGAMKWC